MLFEELDRIKRHAVTFSLVLMFCGLTLLMTPVEYVPLLGSAVAFVLAVWSVLSVLSYISSKKALIHCIRLLLGLMAGALAVALYTFDHLFENVLWWMVGTVPVILGVYFLAHSLTFSRRSGRKGWWVLTIMSSLLVAFGAIVLWNPLVNVTEQLAESQPTRIVGGSMMYSSVVAALSLVWLWPTNTGVKEA